jgi:hypothetical protein
MNFEKWGVIFKWIAIPVTAFFFLMIVYGIYLGVTGESEFTFQNSPEPEAQQTP